MRPCDEQEIMTAVRAWDAACRVTSAMTHQMGRLDCLAPLGRQDGPSTFSAGEPCWKFYEWSSDQKPDDDWCVNCTQRQELYLARKKAAQHRGAKLRRLRWLIRHAVL